jgi:hypothetical protein
MLVALLAVLLFGGSGTSSLLAAFDQAQSSIKTQVKDPARSKALVDIAENAEKAVKGALKNRAQDTKALLALLRSYEGNAADSQHVLQRMNAESEAAQKQMIVSRFELQSRMSREEWATAARTARSASMLSTK